MTSVPEPISATDSPRTARRKKETWEAWAHRRAEERSTAVTTAELDEIWARQQNEGWDHVTFHTMTKEDVATSVVGRRPPIFLPDANTTTAIDKMRYFVIITDEVPHFFFDPIVLATIRANHFRAFLELMTNKLRHLALVKATLKNPGCFVSWWPGNEGSDGSIEVRADEDERKNALHATLEVGFAATRRDFDSLCSAVCSTESKFPMSLNFAGSASTDGLHVGDEILSAKEIDHLLSNTSAGTFDSVTFFTTLYQQFTQIGIAGGRTNFPPLRIPPAVGAAGAATVDDGNLQMGYTAHLSSFLKWRKTFDDQLDLVQLNEDKLLKAVLGVNKAWRTELKREAEGEVSVFPNYLNDTLAQWDTVHANSCVDFVIGVHPVPLRPVNFEKKNTKNKKEDLRMYLKRQVQDYYLTDHPIPSRYEVPYTKVPHGVPLRVEAQQHAKGREIPLAKSILDAASTSIPSGETSVRVLFFNASGNCIVVEEVDCGVVTYRAVLDGGYGKASTAAEEGVDQEVLNFASTAWEYLQDKEVDLVISTHYQVNHINGLLAWLRDTPAALQPKKIMVKQYPESREFAHAWTLRMLAKSQKKLVEPSTVGSTSGRLRFRLLRPIARDSLLPEEEQAGNSQGLVDADPLAFMVTFDVEKIALLSGERSLTEILGSVLAPYNDYPLVQIPRGGREENLLDLSQVENLKPSRRTVFVATGAKLEPLISKAYAELNPASSGLIDRIWATGSSPSAELPKSRTCAQHRKEGKVCVGLSFEFGDAGTLTAQAKIFKETKRESDQPIFTLATEKSQGANFTGTL